MNATPDLPATPREFLTNWTASRGNLRNFLETTALAPLDDAAQRAAGEAAAAAAVDELFGLKLDDFAAGVDSVRGAYESSGTFSRPDPAIPPRRRGGRFLRRG